MKTAVRGLLAIVIGLLLGGFANMGLVTLGPVLIPSPPGVDMARAESLQAGIQLLEPRHFLFPFLAHALGTLIGAVLAFLIASARREAMALAIGVLFLAGGIAACFLIPAPLWFMALDLVVAYVPMAWLGIFVGHKILHSRGQYR